MSKLSSFTPTQVRAVARWMASQASGEDWKEVKALCGNHAGGAMRLMVDMLYEFADRIEDVAAGKSVPGWPGAELHNVAIDETADSRKPR